MASKVADSPLYDILKQLKAEIFSDLRVCLPGTIAAVDAATGTVSVDLGVMQNIAQFGFPRGRDFIYPRITDCPIFSVQGGGVGAVMPVEAGDECLVIFSDRATNNWFTTGEAMPLPSFRMHDLGDGFVLVGLNSLQNKLLTPLLTNEGGICETANAAGAKVVVNSATHKVSIKNASQDLATVLANLVTALNTLNAIVASMTTASIAAGTPQAAAAANTAAITAVTTALAALLY
jgi:hypothetical protein